MSYVDKLEHTYVISLQYKITMAPKNDYLQAVLHSAVSVDFYYDKDYKKQQDTYTRPVTFLSELRTLTRLQC